MAHILLRSAADLNDVCLFDADFDRCSSTSAAESKVGRGSMTGVFGAQADCKNEIKACLSRCKSR